MILRFPILSPAIYNHIYCIVSVLFGDRRGRARMVVRFTTTNEISAYHNSICEFESRS
jgi:hypothetical protein